MAWCFSTRASVATVLTTHPCTSRCLRVNLHTPLRHVCNIKYHSALSLYCFLYTNNSQKTPHSSHMRVRYVVYFGEFKAGATSHLCHCCMWYYIIFNCAMSTVYSIYIEIIFYTPSQWETMLQCYVASHWLGTLNYPCIWPCVLHDIVLYVITIHYINRNSKIILLLTRKNCYTHLYYQICISYPHSDSPIKMPAQVHPFIYHESEQLSHGAYVWHRHMVTNG